jgi:hypothetical protein
MADTTNGQGARSPLPAYIKPDTHSNAARKGGIPVDVDYCASLIYQHFDAEWRATLVRLLTPLPLPKTAPVPTKRDGGWKTRRAKMAAQAGEVTT